MQLTQDNTDAIRDLLLWHSVAKVNDDTLVLDDGTELVIVPNDGCGGCTNGRYDISALNGCENVITNVTFMDGPTGERNPYDGDDWAYQIFVYAENKQINLLSVEGNDGNGYYGTGYSIRVTLPKTPVG